MLDRGCSFHSQPWKPAAFHPLANVVSGQGRLDFFEATRKNGGFVHFGYKVPHCVDQGLLVALVATEACGLCSKHYLSVSTHPPTQSVEKKVERSLWFSY